MDNGEWVEGLLIYDNYIRVIRNHIFIHDHIEHHYKSSEDFEINTSTLQVMTTDGWADIADVEVVRKNPAVSGSVCKHCGCERDKHTVLGMCLDRVKHFEAN